MFYNYCTFADANFTMMNFKSFLAIPCLSLILFSCTKDKSVEKNSTQSSTTYQPVTSGSTWYYQDNLNAKGNFTLTATGLDTTANGINFNIFTNKPDSTSTLYETLFAQNQNDYYALGFINTFGNNALLYLEDTTANSTWKQNISLNVPQLGGQTTAEIDFTLAQTNISYTIGGNTYSNVAHVSLLVKVQVPGAGLTPAGVTGDLYFARGVGIISVVVQNNGSKVEDVNLAKYTIK